MTNKLTLKGNLYLPSRCIHNSFQKSYQKIIQNYSTGFVEIVNPNMSDIEPLFGGLYNSFLDRDFVKKNKGKTFPHLFQVFIKDINADSNENSNDNLYYSVDVLNGTEQDYIKSIIHLNSLTMKDRGTLAESLPIHLREYLKNDEFLNNLDLMQKLPANDLNVLSTTLTKHLRIVKDLKNIF